MPILSKIHIIVRGMLEMNINVVYIMMIMILILAKHAKYVKYQIIVLKIPILIVKQNHV